MTNVNKCCCQHGLVIPGALSERIVSLVLHGNCDKLLSDKMVG